MVNWSKLLIYLLNMSININSISKEELYQKYKEMEKNYEKTKYKYNKYKLILDGCNHGIWEIDIIDQKIYISEKDQKNFHLTLSANTVSMSEWQSLIHEEDLENAKSSLKNYIKHGNGLYENLFRVRTKYGYYKWVESKGTSIHNDKGEIIGITGTHTDLTDKIKLDKKLYEMAYYDHLTGIPNVHKMKDIYSSFNQKKGYILLYLDIDNFSYVNNTMGYEIGNSCIKALGKLLIDYYPNDIVVKASADEFIILINEANLKTSLDSHLKRLLSDISNYKFYKNKLLHLTASIGVTHLENSNDFFDCLKQANTALYCSKESGKNQYQIYNSSMDKYAYNYLDIVGQIRYGIEKKEFEMYYQPIIDSKTLKIAGFEALIRWQHPFRGYVSPGEFIPIAEKSGQILEVEKWILNNVFSQIANWQNENNNSFFFSINLSAKGIIKKEFIDYILDLVFKYKLDPKKIELEITETAVIENIDKTLKVLNKLNELGFIISLDDFGTGYSSLNYLKTLPINKVKLDRSFIKTLKLEGKDKCIVTTIIELSHNMNLNVVAEGVENKEQSNLLKELNCDYLQGYYHGRPMDVNSVNNIIYSINN